MDGELSGAIAEAVRLHLRSCTECARKRGLLETTRRAFQSVADEAVTPSFDAAVFERLRERRRRVWWISAAAAVAAALAVVLLRLPVPPGDRTPVAPTSIADPAAASVAVVGGPGWADGEINVAVDCGVTRAVVCTVDIPCRYEECSSQ